MAVPDETFDALLTRYQERGERIAALETALRALVERPALRPDYMDNWSCVYCDQYPEHDSPPHADDCPWQAARALVGEG